MIYITRPVTETHKTVTKTVNKELDNHVNYKKSDKPSVFDLQLNPTNNRESSYTREDLENAVEDTNRIIFKDNEKFKFEIHERTNRLMVKLVNTETEEIIKEIPPEKILDLVASIWDLVGILVDERG